MDSSYLINLIAAREEVRFQAMEYQDCRAYDELEELNYLIDKIVGDERNWDILLKVN